MQNHKKRFGGLIFGLVLAGPASNCVQSLPVPGSLDSDASLILLVQASRATAGLTTTVKKRIFEHGSTINGAIGGIAAGDAICNASAQRPDTTKTYKALLSAPGVRVACSSANCGPGNGPAEHVDWIFLANTEYYQTNLTTRMFVTNSDAIFSALENALPGGGTQTWTGLGSNWVGGNYCFNGGPWLDSSGGITGIVGDNDQPTSLFFSNGTLACSGSAVLVCVEQ